MRMLLLGDPVSAEHAHRIGLVDEVVGVGQAETAALAVAARLAAASPGAVQAIKRAVNRGLTDGIDAGMKLEEEFVGPLFASAEARAAVAALLTR
jgi:enoyl-CoA hydratase/carnithine racemase